jgi:predicted phosphodiesterase
MKKVLSIVLCAALLLTFCAGAFSADDKTLRFKNGEFKILVLSDTQDDQFPAYDMVNLITLAIEETSPDLIVFTGDLVEDSRAGDIGIDGESFREGVVVNTNGEIDHDKTKENVIAASDAVLSVFQKSGVPFALVQGNNDHKVGLTNEEWLEIYSGYSNSLAFDMSDDSDGRIDYRLSIYGSDGAEKFGIWVLDTGRGGLNADQIDWYSRTAGEITEQNGGEPIPAILFQHIQAADIGNLFVECSPFDEGARAAGGKFYRLNPETAAGYNFFAYKPCEPTDEFKAWKEQGDVIGAYFGHQHVEGFTGTYDGIEMGFNYGSEFAKIGPYGCRLITLHEDDVTNYDNEMFTYEGSVKTGNARFEKQIDEPYKDYGNSPLKFIMAVKNLIISMVSVIIDFVASL